MPADPFPVAARFLSVADLEPRGIATIIGLALALKAGRTPTAGGALLAKPLAEQPFDRLGPALAPPPGAFDAGQDVFR